MPIPLILFIIIPIAELLLILKVADLIGGGYTLLMVIATAFIGVSILKRQGLSTFSRANTCLRSGQLPAQEIVEGRQAEDCKASLAGTSRSTVPASTVLPSASAMPAR